MKKVRDIAKMIDHSVLHPTYTDNDLVNNCAIAKKYDVATVCVKPYHTSMAYEILKDCDVAVCAVTGFPHGNSTIDSKIAETFEVINNGATEVDMVVNIGKVQQGDWSYIDKEIELVNKVCLEKGAILKVIFETDFLPEDRDKIKLCEICNKHNTAFVKTSTGYGFVKGDDGKYFYKGATEHDVSLMRKHCNPGTQVKASGGIRTLNHVLKFCELGVTRIGATATKEILEEAERRFTVL